MDEFERWKRDEVLKALRKHEQHMLFLRKAYRQAESSAEKRELLRVIEDAIRDYEIACMIRDMAAYRW